MDKERIQYVANNMYEKNNIYAKDNTDTWEVKNVDEE